MPIFLENFIDFVVESNCCFVKFFRSLFSFSRDVPNSYLLLSKSCSLHYFKHYFLRDSPIGKNSVKFFASFFDTIDCPKMLIILAHDKDELLFINIHKGDWSFALWLDIHSWSLFRLNRLFNFYAEVLSIHMSQCVQRDSKHF